MSINDKPTTEDNQGNDTVDEVVVDELSLLKQRATLMGINFSNNIGLASLKAKIAEVQDKETKEEEKAEAVSNKKLSLHQQIRRDQTKLIRVSIQNLDPKKRDLEGEIFTVANEYMGTVRKFVAYGEKTQNGYHIPYCIYKHLLSRKFLLLTEKRPKNGQPYVEESLVNEFAITVLPPLTEEELYKLGQAQIAAGSLE